MDNENKTPAAPFPEHANAGPAAPPPRNADASAGYSARLAPLEAPSLGEAPAEGPSPTPAPAFVARPRARSRAVEIALIVISLVLAAVLTLFIIAILAVGSNLGSAFTAAPRSNNPPAGSFSVLTIEGTISSGGSYGHAGLLQHIKDLTEDEGNEGILLYLDTPGGGVYESDELYRALEAYKEATGRPVYAYMGATCASGGYYISMAADHITANYNTITGSIGVYISLTDSSELYEKIGVKQVLIRSGPNKGVGMEGVEITPEQQAVYQSSVDESYERFLSLVVAGRGLDEDRARELSDGRIYTANQALENGLVDELGDWDGALAAFEELTGAEAFYPNFSTSTALGDFLSSILDRLPQSETQAALALAESLPSGVPLAYAPELAN